VKAFMAALEEDCRVIVAALKDFVA